MLETQPLTTSYQAPQVGRHVQPTPETYMTPAFLDLGEVALSTLGGNGDYPERYIDNWTDEYK